MEAGMRGNRFDRGSVLRLIGPTVGAMAALALLSSPSWAGRDLCKMLKDKGVLTDVEYNECKAAQEKQDVEADAKSKETIASRLPKWVDMLTPFGDVRTRYEGFYAHRLDPRNRFRFRARIGLTANITDEVGATVRLATGDSNDPISTNQTFSNTFTHKSINLDWAYITLKPGKTFGLQPGWGSVTAGKFGVSAYRVSEMVFDDDLSPEGATETLNLIERKEGFGRNLRLNGFQWVVDEVANAADPWMGGAQLVADTAVGSAATWTIAVADYHWDQMNAVARKFLEKSSSSFNSSLANSNTLVKDKTGKITGFESGFNVIDAITELDFANPIGIGVPGGIFGELIYNTQADGRNLGGNVGAGIGKAGKDWYHDGLRAAGDWGAGYTFEWVEKDATPSMFSYSDVDYVQSAATQKGSTNVIANIIRFDYEPFTNFQLTAKVHLINALDRDASVASLKGNSTLARTQLDAVLKF